MRLRRELYGLSGAAVRELTFTCELQSDAETVHAAIMRPALFLHVAAPLVRFAPTGIGQFPQKWAAGEYRGSMKLFGLIPIGWQAIIIDFPAKTSGALVLTDKGYGPMLRQWEHRIEAHPMKSGGTRYVDRLKMDAGLLTPIARLMVAQFFKHRQRRLMALDQDGFASL